jgi:lipocalin
MLRYQGKWYTIVKQPYESEHQSVEIAWMQIKQGMTPHESYREFFKKQREESKILYPVFRKDVD